MRGGARTGAGRKPGSKDPETLEKEKVLEAMRQRYMKVADQLVNAQVGLAVGSQYLYKIEKEKITGPKGGTTYRAKKPELVTSQLEIESYLEGQIHEGDLHDENDRGATYYFLTTKDPENPAIVSILDRTFGKSKETIEHQGEVGLRIDV